MLWLFEIIVYTVYMYGFVLLSILCKPSIITLLLFFIYCMYTTWNLYIGCTGEIINNSINKTLLIVLYSSFCLTSFYLIHTTWKKYKNNIIYQLILLGFPIYYYAAVNIAEKLFDCKDYHTILFPERLFISTAKTLFSNITTYFFYTKIYL